MVEREKAAVESLASGELRVLAHIVEGRAAVADVAATVGTLTTFTILVTIPTASLTWALGTDFITAPVLSGAKFTPHRIRFRHQGAAGGGIPGLYE